MIFVDAVTMTFLWRLRGIEISSLVFLKTDYFHYAGKLKNKKVKNDKLQTTEAPQDEKTETVDQIKKKYGYTTTSSVSIHLLTYSAYKEMIDFWNHFGSLFWTLSTMHSSVIPKKMVLIYP